MRLTPVLALAVALGLTAPALAAEDGGSTFLSDPALGEACAGAGTAHTSDVVVDGRTVVATWTIGEDAGLGRAVSHDGGRTWTRETVPFTTCTGGPLVVVVDPHLAMGADGTPWLSASGALPPSGPAGASSGDAEGRVLVAVGARAPVNVFPDVITERGFLETDRKDPDRGWVLTETLTRTFVHVGEDLGRGFFVPGAPDGHLLLGRTDDGGRTWQRSVLRTASPGGTMLALGLVRTGDALVALSVEIDLKDPAVAAGVVASQFATSRGPIAAQTSTDGGRTWSAPSVLGVLDQASLLDVGAGDGVLAVAVPQHDGSLPVFTSSDAGRTWTRTVAATGVAQPTTGVAVDRRGRVTVLSYDLADDGVTYTPQVSISRDRGRTFASPLPVGLPFALPTRALPVPLGAPFDTEGVASGSHVAPAGPYNGADSDGKQTLVAFVADDDRDGRLEARLVRLP